MIIRHLAEAIRAQNWFTVIIELVIVVLGVFIGLQAANWNEERTDAIREKEVLADLLEDLQADRASLSASTELATLGIDAGNILLLGAGLEPIQSISVPGQFDVFTSNVIDVALPAQPRDSNQRDLWKYSTSRLYPSHNDQTIETIIAAGNSSVIKNTQLFRDLRRYRTFWTGVESAQVNTFRPIRDRTVFVGQEHGFSPLSPIDQNAVSEALIQDPALRGALKTMLEYTIAHRDFFYRLQQQSEALTERVEAELKK